MLCLHYNSSHPVHTKQAIPYSQAVRYRRIISEEEVLSDALDNLQQMFLTRDYPKNLVSKQIQRVKDMDRQTTLKYRTKQEKLSRFKSAQATNQFLPLIITYHPNYLFNRTMSIHKIIFSKWNEFLAQNDQFKTIFKDTLVKTVFKKGQSLSQLLTSSRYPPKWHREHSQVIEEEDIINILALFLAENEELVKQFQECDKVQGRYFVKADSIAIHIADCSCFAEAIECCLCVFMSSMLSIHLI